MSSWYWKEGKGWTAQGKMTEENLSGKTQGIGHFAKTHGIQNIMCFRKISK